MSNYTTVVAKLIADGIDPITVNLCRVNLQLEAQGLTPIGYQPSVTGIGEQYIYDATEGFDDALARCGMEPIQSVVIPPSEPRKTKLNRSAKQSPNSID